VAGTGRFDSRVMERLGERVFCKVGAEGRYCAALPEAGLGVAIKMDDGNTARAAEVVMAALIEKLLPLSGEQARHVRLQLNESNWFHLDEVEVMGVGDATPGDGGRDYTGYTR